MKQEDNWSAKFREKMSDYSLSAPDEVWEELEKELSSAKIVKIRYCRLRAIAAVILLFLLSSVGVYIIMNTAEEKDYPVELSESILPVDESFIPDLPVKEEYLVTDNDMKLKSLKQHNIVVTSYNVPVVTKMERTVTEDTTNTTVGIPGSHECISEKDKVPVMYGGERPKKQNIPVINKRYREKDNSWTLGLYAGNHMLASEKKQYGFSNLNRRNVPVLSSLAAVANPAANEAERAYRDIMFNNINDNPRTSITHRFPLSFGVTVRKDINDRFSIESGLTYSLLSSELTAGNASYYVQEQKLHYLGIPLKGNWNYVKKKYFTLYLSAGGMVETCISSQLRTKYKLDGYSSFSHDEELKVDRLQWSISASTGVQYDIIRHIGIYFEPGIVYYFNDGTQISTIRKEKPFNINIQMGLRFGF